MPSFEEDEFKFVYPGPKDNEGFRKSFPCPVRDVIVCQESGVVSVLVLLQTGVLTVLD